MVKDSYKPPGVFCEPYVAFTYRLIELRDSLVEWCGGCESESRTIRQAEPGRPIRAETHPPLSLPVFEEISDDVCDFGSETTVEKSPIASTSDYSWYAEKKTVIAEVHQFKDISEPTTSGSLSEQLSEEVVVNQPQRRDIKSKQREDAYTKKEPVQNRFVLEHRKPSPLQKKPSPSEKKSVSAKKKLSPSPETHSRGVLLTELNRPRFSRSKTELQQLKEQSGSWPVISAPPVYSAVQSPPVTRFHGSPANSLYLGSPAPTDVEDSYDDVKSLEVTSSPPSSADASSKESSAPAPHKQITHLRDLLANSRLVYSRQAHRDNSAADFRSQSVEDKSSDDSGRRSRSTEPPSPAPGDPELEALRHIYLGNFKRFESTLPDRLPFKDPRVIEYLLERQLIKRSDQTLGQPRRASLPEPTGYQYTHSAYSDDQFPQQYRRPQSLEPATYKGKPLRTSYHQQLSVDRYTRSLYESRLHTSSRAVRAVLSPADSVRSDLTIRREVNSYRRLSARSFLDLSPEVPNDLKKLQAELPKVPVPRYRRSRSCDQSLGKMGRMNALDDHERKIIIEFCHLLEKSKQLFNGLRELPQYGHKQWHAYFGKTFDVYTKLWKFQQQHRAILDSKYGLKRWQIGEIASKIGQLYYHFYLRTSDTAYLNEAFSFYYAIRGRSYYTQACKEDKCELMVKKLRYYARFIVASLLLKKVHLVNELLRELDKQIVEYGNAYEPEDQNEWRIVANEVRTFIEVEAVVDVIHPRDYSCHLSHRLSAPLGPPNASALDRGSPMTLSLREALIIGSNSTQLKFSELTMDMYRIMQTLEREPCTDVNHLYDESPRQRNPPTPSAINNKGYNLDGTYNTGEAPHKQMLFKPSPNQIFLYLSSAVDDLPPNGVILLYLSAEGLIVPNSKHPEEAGGYDIGGLITTSKTDVLQRETSASKETKGLAPKLKEAPVLHPGDLYPFTRRPLFIIVDSDNSYIFCNIPRFFGQPIIILMSPMELPATLYPGMDDQRMEGSLFTLFLHDPLSAVCLCCDIKRMPLEEWERARAVVDSYLKEAAILLSRIRDCVYVAFLSDDFMRLLILRFIFCETILRMHRMFRGRAQRTRCSPPIPDDLYEHPVLTRIVMELAAKLQVRGHFHDPAAVQRE